MTAERILKNYSYKRELFIAKAEAAEFLEARVNKATTSISECPGGGMSREELIEDYLEAKKELAKYYDAVVFAHRSAEALICTIKDARAKDVLERKYIKGEGWTEIADALGVSKRTVHRMHKKGLGNAEKALMQH